MVLIGSKLAGQWYWHQSAEARMDQSALNMIVEGHWKYIRFHEGKFQMLAVVWVPTRPGVKYMRLEGTWVDAQDNPPFWWGKKNEGVHAP